MCKPSLMAKSLRSQSQESILRSAPSAQSSRFDAGFACEPRALRLVDDELRQTLAAAPVETVGDGIFVDELFELLRGAGELRIRERRRQMADGHRGDPALGLRGLAGIRRR